MAKLIVTMADNTVTEIEITPRLEYAFGVAIVEDSPVSRHQSIALTKLEAAVMWAVKAIVLEDPED